MSRQTLKRCGWWRCGILWGEEGGWNPRFSRPFNDWEVIWWSGSFRQFKGRGYLWTQRIGCFGKRLRNGKFFVKSLYGALETRNSVPFPWSIIWSPCVPSKVGFFAWEALWGKVLTLDQLKRKGWTLANRCFLCLVEEESIDHILIHCYKSKIEGSSLVDMVPLWARSVKRCGRQPPYVSFGQFGKEETGLHSK
ncbi:hypothetical protein CK203_032620 [Vitis vinifera]|uniref:Reverse transcriptase zinc-binding domain-containing protein n=1 Tax=Vitis vinifera TaxID=29760 RepID=A0A438HY02_VITVI|nr:hypothetical protein CK203_032620 [Vitis vinifera]